MYPMLAEEFSISNVITEKGNNLLIYNTLTQVRARPNAATYEFVKRCRGDKLLEEIVSELSVLFGEPVEKMEMSLSPLVKKMVENGMISFSPTPLPPRPGPREVRLSRRLQGVSLELTRRCNLHCKHCYSNSGVERENELTTEEVKRVIDELAGMGVLNVLITGGEPLLRPDLFEIIAYVRSKPLSCMVFTNGTLVTEEIAQTFKRLGVLVVSLSLDGLQQTHDAFRGGKSYEKVVKAVHLLKEAGVPVRINVSIHKDVVKEIRALLALIETWGVKEYYLGPVTYTGRQDSEVAITPEDYKEALQQLKDHESARGKETKRNLPYFPDRITCGVGMGNITIKSDGRVTPCINFPDEVAVGDIRKERMADIWDTSPLLNQLREWRVGEKCVACPHVKVCGGGCMADVYRRTGRPGRGDDFECAHFEVYSEYTSFEIDEQYLPLEIR